MIGIIIVNWNSGQQLRECLKSIVAANLKSFNLSRVVVVDNASADGSAEGLADPIQVVGVLGQLVGEFGEKPRNFLRRGHVLHSLRRPGGDGRRKPVPGGQLSSPPDPDAGVRRADSIYVSCDFKSI